MQEIEADLASHGQMGHTSPIPKGAVQHPIETVLMASDSSGKWFHERNTEQEEARFPGRLVLHAPWLTNRSGSRYAWISSRPWPCSISRSDSHWSPQSRLLLPGQRRPPALRSCMASLGTEYRCKNTERSEHYARWSMDVLRWEGESTARRLFGRDVRTDGEEDQPAESRCVPSGGRGFLPCDGNSSVASCPMDEQELTSSEVMRYDTYRLVS